MATSVRKAALASGVGTTIEWYDFFIYGTAAGLVFGDVFFPSHDPLTGVLLSFATFSVGFVARPVGGVVFGHFGDRVGRKTMLVITLTGMGLTTLGIGLLPGYASIGVVAPLLLVCLRFLQGISLGGELGGAVLMTIEHAPLNRRGFYGSWVQLGVPAGLIAGNVVFLLVSSSVSETAFNSWGWRIPFIVGGVFVIIGLVVRLRVVESPTFKALATSADVVKAPFLEVLKRRPMQSVLVCGSYFAIGVTFYGATVFGLSYGKDSIGFSNTEMLWMELLSMAVVFLTLPYFGHLTDKYGRRRIFLLGCVWMLAMTFPWFWFVNSGSVAFALSGFVLFTLGYAIAAGALPAFYAEAFEPNIRYTGFSFAYTAGTMLVGGLTPIVATYLLDKTGGWVAVSVFMTVMSAIAVVSVLRMRDPYLAVKDTSALETEESFVTGAYADRSR